MVMQPHPSLKKGGQKRGNSVYTGVRFRNGKWISEIRVPKKSIRIWLGSHLSAEKAARAYDAALYCLKGEDGSFNFPDSRRPDLGNRSIGSLAIEDIKCIAQQFSSIQEKFGEAHTLSPLQESAPLREFSPFREVSESVESQMVPNLEKCNHFCANTANIEPYIPTFSSEEVPYNPTFVPTGEYLAEKFKQLDHWGVWEGNWMCYWHNVRL